MSESIKILPNGPYQVSPDTKLTIQSIGADADRISREWQQGPEYPEKLTAYFLCRCGRSANKPYCDGAHEAARFNGAETADRTPYAQRAKKYEGEAVDLLDDERCAQLRFCDAGIGAWNLAIKSGDPNNLELAKQECANCSSGRLTLVQKDGMPIEPDLPKEIDCVQDPPRGIRGPLKVTGGIPLTGADGQDYEPRNRYTLCRCGLSKNKPFCDTRHINCTHMEGFDSVSE
ncbi:MAG: CDGSH iron-sulfur domain-containing protein [Oscillospiraceae bacterium]|jgi:CDGSH-type Zn-finger protein|nr:CDGSH iron-sulfur domain-containing protein [Oscillospiraceae bacterium]